MFSFDCLQARSSWEQDWINGVLFSSKVSNSATKLKSRLYFCNCVVALSYIVVSLVASISKDSVLQNEDYLVANNNLPQHYGHNYNKSCRIRITATMLQCLSRTRM